MQFLIFDALDLFMFIVRFFTYGCSCLPFFCSLGTYCDLSEVMRAVNKCPILGINVDLLFCISFYIFAVRMILAAIILSFCADLCLLSILCLCLFMHVYYVILLLLT